MNKKILSKKSEIIKDYKGIYKNRAIELKFLRKVSKSKVFVSKSTGVVFNDDIKPSEYTARLWSDKIFSNKTNGVKSKFTADTPLFSSRHYYAMNFLKNKINLKDKVICDFGAGEGNLLLKFSKYLNLKKLIAVEPSSKNCELIKKKFHNNKKKIPTIINSTIENYDKMTKKKCDVAILTWTLCNCSEPLDVIKKIYNSLNKNGYLLVGESSRILVPFKKPIHNYFNIKKRTGMWHPWHFSFNGLVNLLKVNKFKVLYYNRYYNEDNIFLIVKKSNNKINKFEVDNYKHVVNFFQDWLKVSTKFKKFIDIN